MTIPTIVDWDADGRLDLVVVSHNRFVRFLRNTGTPALPRFDLNELPVSASWQLDPLPAGQFLDQNGDGAPDLTSGFSVYFNTGQPLPGFLGRHLDLRGKAHPASGSVWRREPGNRAV